MCYLPEHDPIQDMLETKTKTAFVKVTHCKTGIELQVAIQASGTPQHILIYMCRTVYVIKQMGLVMKFKEQVNIINRP